MDYNKPIFNKYIHILMYIFVWENTLEGYTPKCYSGYPQMAEFQMT